MPVPNGYTLDQPDQQSGVNLPQGYTLDSAQQQPQPQQSGGALSTAGDVAMGVGKELLSTATSIPSAIAAHVLPSSWVNPQKLQENDQITTPTNTAQAVGKYGTQAAEVLLPVIGAGSKVVSALDFSAKKQAAGALLQSVAADANKVPVELENASDAALKLMDWQKKTNLGPTINKFLNRITSPTQGPLTYEDARDFYQLLGRLSADETSKLAPTIQRSLGELVSGLKTDIGNAADQVGRAADYYKGLGDYASASKYQGWYDAVKDTLAKEGVQYAAKGAGGVIGAGTAYKLWQWLNGK